MALSNTSTLLIKTTYKALLKTARRLDAAAPVGTASTAALAQRLGAAPNTTMFEAVRRAFRPVPAPAVSAGINAAFSALREANKLAVELEAPPKPLPPASRAVFRVGQVFRHRQFGYRAVIIARDESCQASPCWASATGAARLPRGLEQPYYTCLVDLRDRAGAHVSYVAEDNVCALRASEDAAVVHPLLARYFAVAADGQQRLLEAEGGDEPPRSGGGGGKAMAV